MTAEIIEEYIISGKWTKKSEYPLSTYILCIVLSEKKNALITKKEERDNKNKAILRETKL
jgi:hypothetical protein